ncbi:protein-methionine-sulfoxide reductase catalytic subunit MsrP [Phaeobacter inhibens]|uniref:Protein-methionine-sulfoxide reductase catalytic subunit MsrP n=1 Tax=Phaeobacter inhibens TaxID=221822 RepID=A0ABM6RIA0_9RHOB|nr:protein-methionine-sulfoxide reductase catalytic subunit MsrP [Phaeobacter inhibens]AUQ51528.1 putative molybdopterin-binding oxidoreductase [Phaeobacter inhibens]AUQ96110.1 putative molybdopterin-binding oxidoreductase [Phaeobacter inhibens]AUR21333.1 putative molybdopterin-binding oxidoreductase [Phaeobacter inhibens]UWR52664.1 protein-methionine-sulfoxide reductase catalytic subunit MsrP [Phaeobacter inhibens]UWR68232.1 protein-methionine-sulfoxide reductase catalytic subunit MsrP [Phaeo
MAHRWKNDLSDADVTPYAAFLNRRQIMAGLGSAVGLGLAGLGGTAARAATEEALEPNSWEDVTTYCNFYEFGTGKGDPAAYAGQMTTEPWSVEIDGLVERPGSYSMAQILDAMTLEDRIYRFRCVEAWSMVVPWQGFELSDLLNLAGVQDGAKYVAFETLYRPSEMPGTAYNVLDWPYREGLRLDEAQHPLTIMATGIFGKPLPNQNGAPLRLVVPWKYGFKSIKSIVRITLTDQQPQTSWNMANAREYGFYSNVNPTVDHPRWSQASERRIGGGLFARREPTLMFNGYEKDVAALYQGMDLAENF